MGGSTCKDKQNHNINFNLRINSGQSWLPLVQFKPGIFSDQKKMDTYSLTSCFFSDSTKYHTEF